MTHLQLSLMHLLKKQCQVILKPLSNYNIYTPLKIELAIISIREIVPFKMHLHIFFFTFKKDHQFFVFEFFLFQVLDGEESILASI